VLFAIDMLVAILLAKLPQGPFSAWPGSMMGQTGFELEGLLLAASIALALLGAGIWSVDRRLFGGDSA
jgi:uncharacterized membrane protein YphA (DoxX/SURF4 family)